MTIVAVGIEILTPAIAPLALHIGKKAKRFSRAFYCS